MMHSIFRRIDWQLIIPSGVLIVVSLATLFSDNPSLFRAQLIFALLGGAVFLFFSQVDLEALRAYSAWIYWISFLGLLFLLFLGISSHGAVRWLDVLGFRIQFSEIFKPFLAISLASFLANRERNVSTGVKALLFLLPIAFLIYRQPDLGSALLYVLTLLMTFVIFGFPLWWFGMGALGIGVMMPVIWQFLHDYQRQRLLTFLHLSNDPLGTSYNAIQAVIAVGSGGIFGKGLGQGTQSQLRFLPEQTTDFIFANLSEALGFMGAGIVIGAFIFLLYRFYSVFLESEDTFEKIFVGAGFSLILIQFFVNIGMNIGLLPIVGVPLPFVSYGGSSLISSAIFLGLTSGIATKRKRKSVLEIM